MQRENDDEGFVLFQARAEAIFQLGRNWIWDVMSDRLYWSEEITRTFGLNPDTSDGKGASVAKLIHPDDAWKPERAVSEALQGQIVEPFEYRVLLPDRTERVVLVKDMQLDRFPDQKTMYLFGVVQDITERKQLEEQLGFLNAELELRVRSRTAELELANQRLQEMDRLKSMFLATTSHELRTPLNSIIGFIGMTLQEMSGELNDEQKDNLSRAYGSAMHLLSLISDVIDITKIEAGKTEAFPERVLLEKVVLEATGAVAPQLRARGLALEVEIPPGSRLVTDRRRLLQCLINLLGNAVKFTETGRVRVAARCSEDAVEISVSDTGIGVAQRDLPRLFRPFERLESHLHAKAGGTGLGLYLTRKLCTDILLGTVSVQSREGVGSTFTLKIARDIRRVIYERVAATGEGCEDFDS